MTMEPYPVSSRAKADVGMRVHLKTIICIASVSFGYMAQLSAVVGAGLLAQDMGELVGHSSQTVWFSSLITILTVALCPPISQAADYWGRKWFLVVLSAAGVVGCIIISRAKNFGTLLAGFAILGLNYGCQSLLMTIVSEVLPRRQRPWGQAAVNAAGSIGGIGGVLMGGGLLRYGNIENCRIYWYVMAGIFALSTICCVVGYDPPPRDQQLLKTSEKLGRLDWIGYALFAPGLAIFSMALAWSDNPYPWSDAHVVAPFTVGVLMIILFIVYEWRFKKDGILHYGLWRHRNFAISLFVIFVEGLAYFANNTYFAFEISVLYGDDLLIAATNFGITFCAGFTFSGLFGLWSAKRKALRAPLVVGCASLLLFFILMATVESDTPRAALWVYPIFSGLGLASIIPVSMAAAQLATAPELITIASALMVAMRSLGGAVSLAIDNAIFNSSLDKEIPAKISAATLPLGLPPSSLPSFIEALLSGSQEAVAHVPDITPAIAQAGGEGLKEAYVIAFRNAWIASAAFCALLTFCKRSPLPSLSVANANNSTGACFVKEQEEGFTRQIEAPAEVELIVAQAEAKRQRVSAAESMEERTSEKAHAQHKDTVDV